MRTALKIHINFFESISGVASMNATCILIMILEQIRRQAFVLKADIN